MHRQVSQLEAKTYAEAREKHHETLEEFWHPKDNLNHMKDRHAIFVSPENDERPFWVGLVVKPPPGIFGDGVVWTLDANEWVAGVHREKGFLMTNVIWFEHAQEDDSGNVWYKKWKSADAQMHPATAVSMESQRCIDKKGAFSFDKSKKLWKIAPNAPRKWFVLGTWSEVRALLSPSPSTPSTPPKPSGA